jgi:S-DNA-T family DNA segregation ATPase FtsK/SpoIIIE
MAEKTRNSPKASPVKNRSVAKSKERNRVLAYSAGILFAVFVLLSIFSYADSDEVHLDNLSVFDAFKLPFDEGVRSAVAVLENQLGLIGAFTAHFFVNLTIGYFSVVFPALLIMWCVVALTGREKGKPILVTNYALICSILLPALMGTIAVMTGSVPREWVGLVGIFAARILVSLLGSVGSLILLAAGIAVTVIFAVDLDLRRSLDKIGGWYRFVAAAVRRNPGGITVASPDDDDGDVAGRAHSPAGPASTRFTTVEEREGDEGPSDDGGVEDGGEFEEEAASPQGDDPGSDGTPVRIDIQRREIPDEDDAAPEPVLRPTAGSARGQQAEEIDYVFPSVELLDQLRQGDTVDREELEANAELVRAKLAHFGVEIESVSVTPGPVITLYELVPASGVKISRIVSLADDLALALAARGIRIIAPIPGKSAVGVEIPNRNPSIVSLRSVINASKFRESGAYLPLALGKGIAGDVVVDDLSKMPHLLIAGATGSGKSVGINTLMASLLFRLHPSEVKFVIIDPKKIELTQYAKLKYHYLAMSPDIQREIVTTPEDAVGILKSVELEMERRYDHLAAAGVRSIQDYNERFKAGRLRDTEAISHSKIPYLVVVIDELADLMLTAAKEVEEPIARLAQLARAVGIHLVLATQRPSVDVITGVIKANFPARMAFQVSSKIDSRTILDMNGADQLLGNGDMLYLPAGSPKPFRIQNAFISTEEIERLTDHISDQEGFSKPYMLPSVLERKRSAMKSASGQRDEFFEEAARLIVRHQQGSVSLLQRRLKVGYSRAARLVDELESAGIVGPYDGSKAREVLLESEDQLDALLGR